MKSQRMSEANFSDTRLASGSAIPDNAMVTETPKHGRHPVQPPKRQVPVQAHAKKNSGRMELGGIAPPSVEGNTAAAVDVDIQKADANAAEPPSFGV